MTKFKSIGPVVQEIEAKMRVNLVVLGETIALNKSKSKQDRDFQCCLSNLW